MDKVLLRILTGFIALTLSSTVATAAVKVRGDMSHIETVAVVGYSFLREVQVTRFKRKVITLTEGDPEYIMMQEADERVMKALQTLGPFTVMPREEVLASEFYQDESKDPAKKLNILWYFPKGYREFKLKKKSAIALCEALGVDAVILIQFNSHGSTKDSDWGVYSTSTKIFELRGEISIFDSSGEKLISGKTKSRQLEGAKTHGLEKSNRSGNQSEGVKITGKAPYIGNVYELMLDSFMEQLYSELDGG